MDTKEKGGGNGKFLQANVNAFWISNVKEIQDERRKSYTCQEGNQKIIDMTIG